MHEYSIDFIKVTSCLVSSRCTFRRFICYYANFPIQDLFGTCGFEGLGMSLRIKTVYYFNLFSQLWLVLYSGANMLFLQFLKINGSLVV